MTVNNKKGFSLIELSIVLIIIGLLVAGITGGSSLIKSAELRAVMSDIRNYQTAVNAYYTSRGELPGTEGSSEMAFTNSCKAWAAMVNEGIVDAKLESFTTDTSTNKYSCPDMETVNSGNSINSKMKGGFYALGYNNQMLANVIFLVGKNQTAAGMTSATASSTNNTLGTAVVSRKDAKFLDDKMDNGISNSGKIFAFTGSMTNTPDDNGCVYDNSATISHETTRDCGIAMSIGL